MTVEEFIDDWKESGANEESNRQLFLTQLCGILGVDAPDPARPDTRANDYVFERHVDHSAPVEQDWGSIDLYKKGCFVLEAKQGSNAPVKTEAEKLGVHEPSRSVGTARRGTKSWNEAMRSAKNQADRYAGALPDDDETPPFLVVVDVGYCFDLYADFARQGKNYVPFPNQESYRIPFEKLSDPEVQDTLRRVWSDPLSLDPARTSTRVTKDLAESLGRVASSLEDDGYDSDRVAGFLMRCLFTMFAEDVELLPERSFTQMLKDCLGNLEAFPKAVESLWDKMNTGGFHPGLMADVKQFNGHLFEDQGALPVSEAQLRLLIKAAEADWSDVEPAIFGTLLERALDPQERHRLGAHFTPRAYVERLVVPTVIEPLREEWEGAQAAAAKLESEGDKEAAREELVAFHHRLCTLKVLDPACGSGNFLYVTLEHLKRLEAEVLDVLSDYGHSPLDMAGGERVSPEQLLGMEINPRAAKITDVVLWIGYLQWHFRTYGDADRLDPPLLQDIDNIECRDAVLDYDDRHQRTSEDGEPVTMWDRRTYKEDPTTGEMVPDESAQVPVYDYENPEPAEWPEADFIVGNPPFIGNKRMREALGDGYTEAVRDAYLYKVPKSVDFVMYWWYKAAKAVRGKLDDWGDDAKRFGLISTNSIRQTFNRKVMEKQIKGSPPVNLVFAVPDHPWVASKDGSDVRISMTTGAVTDQPGTLQTVIREEQSKGIHWDVELSERAGNVLPNLTTGADVTGAEKLKANEDLSFRGMTLVGDGFSIDRKEAGKHRNDSVERRYVKPFVRGASLTRYTNPNEYVIDLFGLSEDEARQEVPELFQKVRDRVKPEREQNNRASYREKWWIFGEPRTNFRDATEEIDRYIATPRTAKNRVFLFLEDEVVPESEIVAFALEDPYYLGVLSSRIHVMWALGQKVALEDRPRYNNTEAFDPFPFPAATESQKTTIRDFGEQLDAHRKERMDSHDDLTMTALYNVLRKEQSGEELDEQEREIHKKGLVGVLAELHDELDAAVARAYGWEPGLEKETLLQRLVDLNAERRAEEEEGHVRYLRPEYQAPETVETQAEMDIDVEVDMGGGPAEPLEWPSALKTRAQAVRTVVGHADHPLTVEEVAQHFHRARRDDVRDLLETLAGLGLVDQDDESYVA
ncbi:class I SAM-dependent DNA methyltransferase [Salinibacter ruber]|uniref:class I SAM-dependent DNA methyltransferase n=1 Tax=Salinibacter ruber TaxID=146919 RepID=UPI000E57B7D0|nr:DNA methyltransferase [Salinibacter ruber]